MVRQSYEKDVVTRFEVIKTLKRVFTLLFYAYALNVLNEEKLKTGKMEFIQFFIMSPNESVTIV